MSELKNTPRRTPTVWNAFFGIPTQLLITLKKKSAACFQISDSTYE